MPFEVRLRLSCGFCLSLVVGGPVASVLACCHDRTAADGAVTVGCAAGFLGLFLAVIGTDSLGHLLGADQRGSGLAMGLNFGVVIRFQSHSGCHAFWFCLFLFSMDVTPIGGIFVLFLLPSLCILRASA